MNTPIETRPNAPQLFSAIAPESPHASGKIHAVIKLGGGRRIELRTGWINHHEQIGLGDYQSGQLSNGILIPRHGLEPIAEAFADVLGYIGLHPTPLPGQESLF